PQADPVLRLRPVGHAAADRARLRGDRQRRGDGDADLRQGRACRRVGARARPGNRRPGDADDADRHRARRHRHPRRDPGLPRGRQDRHRAQVRRRRLRAPLRRLLRRPGAGGAAAVRGHGGGQRPRPLGRRFDLWRRLRVRAAVRAGDGGRAAADGRAAGRHRDLAGRAGGRGRRARARRRRGHGRPAMSRTVPLAQLRPDVPGIPDVAVAGLALDSRELRPGDAFVAVAGFGRHGLHFAADAARAGARAILFEPPVPGDVPPPPPGAIAVPGLRARLGELADAFHERPSARMTTLGVTGTSGKTSTVQLLAQALELNGVRAGTIGTLGAGPYGRPRPTGFTTPLVLTTHALLAGLRDEGMDAVAMEVSSHALDQGRADGVHCAVAVRTNLSRDHLDYHPDMAHYGATKARLFAMPGLRAAVVNLDDPFGRGLLPTLPATLEVLGTSARGAADAAVRATDVVLDGNGLSFLLHM